MVVGSGAGGGAAARVLAASGARVVVLEEGPLVRQDQLSPVLRDSFQRLFRHGGRQTAFGRANTLMLQGRCVGGTTFVNSAIIWRLPEHVLAQWHRDHGLAPGFEARALDAAAEIIEKEMSVRPVAEGDTANGQDLLLRLGAQRAGVTGRFVHRSEQGCQGSSRCLFGCPNLAKQSTTINYLRRATEDGSSVFAECKVERVIVDGGRAVAVAGRIGGTGPFRGQSFRVGAKKAVIVAASAVQSPSILARSGLKSRHLGQHFMAHPGATVIGLYPQPVNMWTGASQGFEAYGLRDTHKVKVESINVPPEIMASRLPGSGARLAEYIDRMDHASSWSVAVRAEAEGSVQPSRLFGDLVRYTPARVDMERLREGMKRTAQMHFFAGAKEIITGVHGMPEVLTSADQLGAFDSASIDPRAYNIVATHLFGGCRAGADPSRSVVDPQLKLHGVDALYVMDASVFPSNTGVNPQHSIMSLATVAAQRLC